MFYSKEFMGLEVNADDDVRIETEVLPKLELWSLHRMKGMMAFLLG